MAIRHIVIFKLYPEVTESSRRQALQKLRALCGDSPLLQEWRVAESLDTRKGKLIIQNTLFKDSSALQQWRRAGAHKQTVDFMSQISDWLIADYEEP